LQHRVTLISPEQEAAFYAVSERKNSQLCDFVWFQIQTGCRPAEAAKIEAKHLRETGEGVQVVLPAFDEDGKLGHKTGRKTGKARVIYCTADASAMLRRLAAKYPAGPLFRTKRGNEWGEDNRGDQFANARKRVQAKYGEDVMGDDIVMYSCRHTFATRKLAQGYSIEIVAELLGNSVKVCLQHYAHLNLCGNTLWQAIKGNGIGAQAQPAIAVAG